MYPDLGLEGKVGRNEIYLRVGWFPLSPMTGPVGMGTIKRAELGSSGVQDPKQGLLLPESSGCTGNTIYTIQ